MPLSLPKPKATLRRYLVKMTKWGLLVGVALLLIVLLIWPQWSGEDNFFSLDDVKISPRAVGEVAMTNADYQGVDRHNRPYNVRAEKAYQKTGEDNVIILTNPQAEFFSGSGAWVYLEAKEGTYFRDLELLDLYKDVNLYHEDGHEIHTNSARVNVKENSAEGSEFVSGSGPQGLFEGDGFRIKDAGKTVIILGESQSQIQKKQSQNPIQLDLQLK